jgi:hypothetical protein
VVVRLQVELAVREATDVRPHPDAEDVDGAVMGAVEDHLREWISNRDVASLPTAGVAVDFVPGDLVPGARIEHVFVVTCDIEVTRQLQRLIGGSVGP